MFFSDEDRKNMGKLFKMLEENNGSRYILSFSSGDIVEAEVDTFYETDNGLELNDPDYEEYNACAMRIVSVIVDKSKTLVQGKLIEINYHNYPQEIHIDVAL